MDNEYKTILVVDDTESNLDMVLALLQDYDVIPCTSGRDALETIKEEKVDLILLDILMPEMDGYSVCKVLKDDPVTEPIPVIFITAKTDEESIEKAYEYGGADYVTKPFKPKELLARVRVQLQLQDVIRELDYLATRDYLTGVYNRRKFFDQGTALFQQENDELYALMLDIDHFKNINDTYGHDIGDVALKKVAKTISETIPTEAVFGRLGGEEFGVLLIASSFEDAMDTANNIRTNIAEIIIPLDDNRSFSCTISIGVACKKSLSSSEMTLDDLLIEADRALYEAKEGGRNRSIFRER